MKYKVAEPYYRFWKKVFDYIIENELSAFDTLFYVTLTPSVLHLKNKKIAKFFDKFYRQYMSSMNQPAEAPERYHVYLLYVIRMYDLYVGHRRIPQSAQGLKYLYELIMRDFRNAEKEYDFEEAMSIEENMAETKIQPRSWYVINSILQNSNVGQVKQIIEKAVKEEVEIVENDKSIGISSEVSHIIKDYLSGNSTEKINKILEDWGSNLKEDQYAKLLNGKIENDKLILPAKLTKFFVAMLLFYEHTLENYDKYEQAIDQLTERYEAALGALKADIKQLMDMNEELYNKLLEEKTEKIKRVYVDKTEEIELLKKEYEKRIAELQEQIDAWKEIAEELSTKLEEATQPEDIKPFPEPIYIAYYGTENPDLFSRLLSYNVHVKVYSPFKTPRHVPNIPVVFNIDVASHSVWNVIRERKPLLISGSNAEKLSNSILKWLKTTEVIQ